MGPGAGAFTGAQVQGNELLLITGGVVQGDYNGDGLVNPADYAVWRNSLGQTGSGLLADGNGNNIIDQGDYDIWKQNFGQVLPASGNLLHGNDSIPEPTTAAAMALLLAVAAGFVRSR